ncbi:tyrosinase [Colletotrichum spaethianum]|uniref:Tyrosinase n=1 Tax=Colletotrichum spaethianum TaxID=700344 RepID=A0AA37LAK4_9PEZI|nr:tyrosinase [Colletotrichum spaethianum]GKT42783.1 tyrosinase [Colletotrichum spaethianum]
MSVDVKALRNAQASGLTVGVIPKGVNKPLRLEIDDLLQDVELANLYFLALEAFMSKKIFESPFSYYEICGIHGQPWRAWDGVTSAEFGSTRGNTDPQSGYCSHGSVVFPTWHRVYVAQFEFNFPADSKGGFDWSMYDQVPAARDHTIRGLNAATQSANHSYVMRAFDNVYNPVSGLSSQAPQGIWHVMFERQTWLQMSNHWDPRTRDPASVVYNANSLEGFHDNIHNQLATGPRDSSGHMGSPAFAG